MVDYSNYLMANAPEYRQETSLNNIPGVEQWVEQQRTTVGDGVSGNQFGNSKFNDVMNGLDSASNDYANELKSIYDSYGKYASDYGKNAKGIIEALNGDIKDMQKYSDDYQNTLNENKDSFMNGLVLDPNANRTRAEYTGAVANEYDNARESLKHNMISQGLNPYANTGADRQLAMERAQDLGGAAGQAYTDWRQGYNRDKEASLNNKATFLGLQQKAGDQLGQISNVRMAQGGLYGNILNANNNALQNKATGINGLLKLNGGRRAEQLSLMQNKSNNDLNSANIKRKMQENLQNSGLDKYPTFQSKKPFFGIKGANGVIR